MEYVIVENDIITSLRCAMEIDTEDEDKDVRIVPDNFPSFYVGTNVNMFDKNWKLRPFEDLQKEGYVSQEFKLNENNIVVEKTEEEKKLEGLIPLDKYEEIVDGKVVKREKTLEEMYRDGEIGEIEFNIIKFREKYPNEYIFDLQDAAIQALIEGKKPPQEYLDYLRDKDKYLYVEKPNKVK